MGCRGLREGGGGVEREIRRKRWRGLTVKSLEFPHIWWKGERMEEGESRGWGRWRGVEGEESGGCRGVHDAPVIGVRVHGIRVVAALAWGVSLHTYHGYMLLHVSQNLAFNRVYINTHTHTHVCIYI